MRFSNLQTAALNRCNALAPFLKSPVWCLGLFWFGVNSPTLQSDMFATRALLIAAIVLLMLALRVRVFVGLVFLASGFCWATWSFEQHRENNFPAGFERQSLLIEGRVIDLPSVQEGNYRFKLQISRVPNSELNVLLGEIVQLSCYRCPYDISPDDEWSFTVRLKRPHGYASWGAFDYEKYLFRHRIVARGYVRTKDENVKLSEPPFSMHRWRQSIRSQFQMLLPNSGVGGAMIVALTIGDKSGFSKEQRKVFQESGVSHLMAISGLHVGLVFACVCFLVKWLLWPIARVFNTVPRQWLAYGPALAAATTYSALAGFAISTQRALVMLLVYVICRLWARNLSLFHILLIAVFVLLLYDPFSVLDIGFWLSCGAVAIIAFASTQTNQLSLIKLQPTLWLGMLPLSVLFFGQVSLVSPLVNLLAVPLFCLILIPLTLLGSVFVQFGLESIGAWLLILLSQVFSWVYQTLEWATAFQFARWYTTPFLPWQWCLMLLSLSALYLNFWFRHVLWLVLIASVFWGVVPKIDQDQLRVVLLDVGQGLAMVIETSDRVLVYDTGPKYSSGFTTAEAVLLPYLRQRGVRTIDKLIISHADNDHIGGYAAVAEAFNIRETLTSRPDKVVGAKECIAGQGWRYGATHFHVISPSANTPKGSNNHSCVIVIEHHGKRVLISGDIEKQVERFLIQQITGDSSVLKSDIMLVPHQGSKTSSTPAFLDAVQPQLALVAAGYLNHYGHPHYKIVQRYRERGISIMSTIDEGSILVEIDREGWWVSTYRRSRQRFWHYQKVSNQLR